MKTLKYVLTLAAAFSASSVALDISSTSEWSLSSLPFTEPNRCTTAPDGKSYCEFKDKDIVLTCDESQTPDLFGTEMILDCDARKFHYR